MPRTEVRLDRMAARPDAMDVRLRGVEQAIARPEGKMDILAGQIIAKLPSRWQMPAVIGAAVAPLVGSWALVQYPHARGLP